MSAINSITPIYNPKLKPKEQLINEFVVRTKIFEGIFEDIKKSKMKHPEQHYLLIGQRGAGKTTLLERLKYAVEDENSLNKWLIPISLNEEQYNISELSNLWETIAETLEDYHNMQGIVDEMQLGLDSKNYEEAFFYLLIKYLKKYKKKIVLLIDNIGDILSKFDETDIKRLREVLMTSPYIRLIAGSPVVFDGLFDYHKPLLEFFNIIYLKGLDREEMELLLLTLGKLYQKEELISKVIKESPERVEVLRRLTGGIPRTIVMLFNIFVDNQDGKALKDFVTVIDHATPLYKHNMDDLPIQQQKIVDAVAKAWDGVSVKDIKEKVRMEGKNISTQLSLLEKNQLIIKRRLPGSKNYIYMLQDRFFNIWYLMRHGRRNDKKRVEWLVHFFESWLSKDELEIKIVEHIENLKSGTYDPQAAVLMFETYRQCQIDFESKIKLLNQTKKFLPQEMKEAIGLTENEIYSGIEKVFREGAFEKVIEIGKEVDNNSYTRYVMANAAKNLKNYNESETYFIQSLEIYKSPISLIELGILYYKFLDQTEKAKKYLIEGTLEGLKEREELAQIQNKASSKEIEAIEVLIKARTEIIEKGLNEFGNILRDPTHEISIDDKSHLISFSKAGFPEAFVQLGFLEFVSDNLKDTLKFFDEAITRGSKNIMMLAIYTDIFISGNGNNKKAKDILEILISSESTEQNIYLKALIKIMQVRFLLWINEIGKSIRVFIKLMDEFKIEDTLINSHIRLFLLLLIAREQYNSAFNLFKEDKLQLKDRFKPIYYALMRLNGNENELLKMGDELKETVIEVIEEILEMREKYSKPPVEGEIVWE